jgi:hypothetical protein
MLIAVIAGLAMAIGIVGMILCALMRDRLVMAVQLFMVSLALVLVGGGVLILRFLLSVYLLYALLMAAGMGGMIACARSRKKGSWRTPLAIACLLILLVGAGAMVIRSMVADEDRHTVEATVHSRAAGLILGEYLARTAAGCRALVVVEDKHSTEIHFVAGLEGLREGLGGAVTLVDVASPVAPVAGEPGEGPQAMSPERRIHLRKATRATDFDRLLAEYPNCTLIISFVGLSQNPADMAIWKSAEPNEQPRFVLFRSDVRPYREAIRAGVIQAAVVTRPGFEPGQGKVPQDPQAAFDRRFLLVTPENVDQIAAEHLIFEP